MTPPRILVCIGAIAALSCGELQPSEPDSKLNANPNVDPNASANGSPNAAANATPVDFDPTQFGTQGPATMDTKSPDGNALCTLQDIGFDPIMVNGSSDVPDAPWASTVVNDETARCGDDFETFAWRLYNCERIGRGLQPYACDLRLVWSSREHTLDMIQWDYFSHDNLDGETPFDRLERQGIAWRGAAENIATGRDVLALHYNWMDSDGHRGNILGPYTHAGVGVENDASGLLATAVMVTAP